MPIRVQNDLPVKEILEQENIFVMDEMRAGTSGYPSDQYRTSESVPLKEDTELQILRALSNSPAAGGCYFRKSDKSCVKEYINKSHL